MILEVAILDIKQGRPKSFESAFDKAQKILSAMPGYISHQLQRCIENENRYILLVNWENLKDHTEGFRQSEYYKEWKTLLHDFYEPFPKVEHYSTVFTNGVDK